MAATATLRQRPALCIGRSLMEFDHYLTLISRGMRATMRGRALSTGKARETALRPIEDFEEYKSRILTWKWLDE